MRLPGWRRTDPDHTPPPEVLAVLAESVGPDRVLASARSDQTWLLATTHRFAAVFVDGTALTVIGTYDNVRRASLLAMAAGADFIKTSTGKVPLAAALARGRRGVVGARIGDSHSHFR